MPRTFGFNMKKRGFTLAEILGVIVIIGLLLLLVTPVIVGRLAGTKTSANESANRLIYNAASQHIIEHRQDYPTGKKYCITVRQLINEGKLASPVKDVTTGKTVDDHYSILVSIYSTGNEYYEGPFEDTECQETASIPMIDFIIEPSGTSWVRERKVTIKYPDGTNKKYTVEKKDSTAEDKTVSDSADSVVEKFNIDGKIVASMKYGGTKTESKINVVNIDSVEPKIEIVGQPTCKKSVSVNLTDTGGSKLKDYAVVKGIGRPQDSDWKQTNKVNSQKIKFTAEDEVEYTIYVRDNAGNEANYRFKPNVRHVVTFNTNGGTPQPATRDLINNRPYDQNGHLPNRDEISKVGYIFRGWYEDNNTFNKRVLDNTVMCVNTENNIKNLYVKWEAKKVTITFYRNISPSDTTTITQTFTYDVANQKFSEKNWDLDKVGYTLQGWNENRNATSAIYTELNGVSNDWIHSTYDSHNTDKSDTNPKDHALYLIWKANDYNISYDLNKGTGSTTPNHGTNHPTKATYDQTFTLNNPSRTGYTFTGWNITNMGKSGVTHYLGSNTTTSATANGRYETSYKNLHSELNSTVTITATWRANTYTLSFDGNGGTPGEASRTQTFDSGYSLPSASRTGYTFLGWFTAATGGSQVTTSTKYTTASNSTVYAHWQANTYTISYNGNGATGGSTGNTTCTYDSNCSLAGNGFTRRGYSFDGWWTAASGGTRVTGYTPYKIAGATTLYAHWIDNLGPSCGAWSGESTSWTGGNRTISVGCDDNGGVGCKQSSYIAETFTSGEVRTAYVSAVIEDNNGNQTTCSKNADVYVDKVGPTVEITEIRATSLVSEDCIGKTSGSCTVNARYVGNWGFNHKGWDDGSGFNRYEFKYNHNGYGNVCPNWTSSCNWGGEVGATWFHVWDRGIDNVGNPGSVVEIDVNFNA